jgi:carbamoyl-phosphate synthase small subunit
MQFTNSAPKAYLRLDNGKTFQGFSFGASGTATGELVFVTAMTGYQEIITSPEYAGKIVVQTFPLIGNYGISTLGNKTDKTHISGYIVREWCDMPSNYTSEGDIDEFLKKHGIVGLCDIDTRSLTRLIRKCGTLRGTVETGS